MPIMAEIGYDQLKHDERIRDILGKMPIPIGDVVPLVARIYLELYKLSPPEINQGMCQDFAYDLGTVMGEGEVLWVDEMPDWSPEMQVAHAFLLYRGRFYDSTDSEGVEDWRHLRSLSGQ